MAKGNDGNYLQHCIEVEAAVQLAKADPCGRLHVALTHGMKPFEKLDDPGGAQKCRLYQALDEAAGEPACSDEREIVRAYRKSRASPLYYPNTAELLRTVIGTDRFVRGNHGNGCK